MSRTLVGNWSVNCGYEEALHSNCDVLVFPVRGTRLTRDKVSIGKRLLSVDAKEVEQVFPLGSS